MWWSPQRGGADHRSRWQCLVMSVTADKPQAGTTANTARPLHSKHARASVVLVQRRLKWAALDLLQRHEGRSSNRKTQSNKDSSSAYRNPASLLQLVKNNKMCSSETPKYRQDSSSALDSLDLCINIQLISRLFCSCHLVIPASHDTGPQTQFNSLMCLMLPHL